MTFISGTIQSKTFRIQHSNVFINNTHNSPILHHKGLRRKVQDADSCLGTRTAHKNQSSEDTYSMQMSHQGTHIRLN